MAGYSKSQLLEISAQLGTAYREAERELTALVAKADLTNWEQQRARAQLVAVRDALTELGETTQKWGQLHLPGLYRAGIDMVDEVAGETIGTFGALHTETVQLLAENLVTNTEDVLQMVGRRVADTFRQAGLSALQETTALGGTRVDATRRMVAALVDDGIYAVQYRDGSVHALGDYGEMVARTVSRECQNVAVENRMAELGEDLVKISTHGGACPLCTPWEGKILSLSGQTPGYPTLDEAKAAGLFHPRCVHVQMPYIARYAEAV